MLAFIFWLSAGEDRLLIPVASKQALELDLPPMRFVSPITASDSETLSTEDNGDDDESSDDFDRDEDLEDDL